VKTVELANIDLTSYIRPGDAVMWGQAAAEPLALTHALMRSLPIVFGFALTAGLGTIGDWRRRAYSTLCRAPIRSFLR
jgi:acetyl-CoA hydrolase